MVGGNHLLHDEGRKIRLASVSHWRRLSSGGRLTRPLRYMLIHSRVELELESRIEQHHREMREAIAAGRAVIEHQEGESQTMAFWQQGSLALQEDDVLRQRLQLRSSPLILGLLDRWWLTAVETERRCAGHSSSSNLPSGTIGSETHAQGLRPVYVAIMDEYDPIDAAACIAEDWATDARGQLRLTQELFCDAIFELCDVWTQEVKEQEYCDFLDKLLEEVSFEVPPDVASLANGFQGAGGDDEYAEALLHPRVFRGDDQVQRIDDFHVGKDIADMVDPTPRQQRGRRQKRRRGAASTIQAGARGKSGRKVANKRKQAVQVIQAGARGRAGRKTASTKRAAVLTFQAHYRGGKSRLQVDMLKGSRLERLEPASSPEAVGGPKPVRIHSMPDINQRPRYLDYMTKPREPPSRMMRPGSRGLGFGSGGSIGASRAGFGRFVGSRGRGGGLLPFIPPPSQYHTDDFYLADIDYLMGFS